MQYFKYYLFTTLAHVFALLVSLPLILLIDQITRSIAGYKLVEGSVGFGTFSAVAIFFILVFFMSLKLTAGYSNLKDTQWKNQFKYIPIRVSTFLILLLLAGIVSGISTSNLENGYTDMTGAALVFLPLYWIADTILVFRKLEKQNRLSALLSQVVQIGIKLALVLTVLVLFAILINIGIVEFI